jgi:hypothetical protein
MFRYFQLASKLPPPRSNDGAEIASQTHTVMLSPEFLNIVAEA